MGHISYPAVIGKIIQRFNVTLDDRFTGILQDLTPITDADRLAWEPQATAEATSMTTAGNTTRYTVPAGERWIIQLLTFQRTGGDYDYRIHITRADVIGGADQEVDVMTNESGTGVIQFPQLKGVVLFPGDRIGVNVSSFVGAGNLISGLLRIREECSS